jgi:hypothetical protein
VLWGVVRAPIGPAFQTWGQLNLSSKTVVDDRKHSALFSSAVDRSMLSRLRRVSELPRPDVEMDTKHEEFTAAEHVERAQGQGQTVAKHYRQMNNCAEAALALSTARTSSENARDSKPSTPAL